MRLKLRTVSAVAKAKTAALTAAAKKAIKEVEDSAGGQEARGAEDEDEEEEEEEEFDDDVIDWGHESNDEWSALTRPLDEQVEERLRALLAKPMCGTRLRRDRADDPAHPLDAAAADEAEKMRRAARSLAAVSAQVGASEVAKITLLSFAALGSLGIKERVQALDERRLEARLQLAAKLLRTRRDELAAKCALSDAFGGRVVESDEGSSRRGGSR